jgi:chromosome segregation ATPase
MTEPFPQPFLSILIRVKRAFRERREKHVKELQEKLEQAEKYAKELEWDNARMKKELAWYQAENKTLKDAADAVRANAVAANNNGHPSKAVFPVCCLVECAHWKRRLTI